MEPTFLIASPQLKDPFFERTVVLVWHHDEDGAIGVVVNRALEQSLAEVLEIPDEDEPVDLSDYASIHVHWGGPVEGTSGTVVTRGRVAEDEGWHLMDGLNITRSQEALIRLLRAGADVLLVLGYAGWGPGQLDQELEQGGWLFTDLDPELIFGRPAEDRYDLALKSLGIAEHQVWMSPISE